MFHRPKTAENNDLNTTDDHAQKPVQESRSEQSNASAASPEKTMSSDTAQESAKTSQTNTLDTKTTETKEKSPMSNQNDQDKQNAAHDSQAPGAQYQAHPAHARPSHFSAGYGNAQQGASHASSSEGRRLVVGEGITMSGEIAACDNLIVEGTVEASLKGAKVLDITDTGVFYGTVEIEEAMIAGRFEGDITVNGRLTVTGSGSITGSISYKELQVEAGAVIDGKISPLAGQEKKNEKPKKAASPRNDNTGNELPFNGNRTAAAE